MYLATDPLLVTYRLNEGISQSIRANLCLSEVLSAPGTDLTPSCRSNLSQVTLARCREPLLQANSTADVLALWAAKRLASVVEADDTG